jgi:uncharacterized protein
MRGERSERRETRSFQVLVKPAGADCNLACEYCFYRGTERYYEKRGPHRMSEETRREMVRQVLSARRAESVFSWQGGEPTLMGLEFFRGAVGDMEAFGAAGQVVGNALQTNGILIDEAWCDFLARYQFLVGLSLDGPPDLHDHYRGGPRGRSQAEALRAGRLMISAGVAVNILAVVTSRSRAKEVYPYLRGEGFEHLQFIPCVERFAGELIPASVSPGAYGDFLCQTFELWWPERQRARVRTFDSVVNQLLRGEVGLCEFGRRCDEYLVVEHDGSVYPCDFFVQPKWRLGNLRETELSELAESQRRQSFAAKKRQLARRCQDCPWRENCFGGCPKYRMMSRGRSDDPTWFCPSYRQFFEHARPRLRQFAEELSKGAEAAF